MIKLGYFWRKGLWALISLSFFFLIIVAFLYIYLESQLPDVDSLKTVQLQVPLRIYSQEGLLIQEYGEKRRIPVKYEDIPPTLIHALLSTEDQRFFEHSGVDIFGLGRAAISMIQTGRKSQGGSTITMQVARNFFLERKKTFLRKFNEILLAIKIDHDLSKEKILELYLNKIYLGNRAYGVGAAAQVYYGKKLQELNIAQLAMIAGLPQAPSTQNPIANPIGAKKRRDHVLDRLLEEKYITEEQHKEAINQPITAKMHETKLGVEAPYVAEMIRQSLYEHFGADAYTKGYKVYTTVKAPIQIAANNAVEKNLLEYDKRHGYRGPVANILNIEGKNSDNIHEILSQYPVIGNIQPAIITGYTDKTATAHTLHGVELTIPWEGLSWTRPALKKGWVGHQPTLARQIVSIGDVVYVQKTNGQWYLTQLPQAEAALVALNPNNGAIEALVGGFNFHKSKFNRATQSSRQPGSTFKPFVYAAALNKGYSLATMVNDAPIVVNDPSQTNLWRPQNANRQFNGPTRLKEGLVKSKNLVSIRILDDIGIDYTIEFVSHFGFPKDSLPKTLSLALGSLSVSPLDLAAAYAVFANGGYKIEPYLIDKIVDLDGEVLIQAKPPLAISSDPNLDIPSDMQAPRVLDKDVSFLMNTALRDVIQHGTGSLARELKRTDLAGKTGSTNDQVDAWFAGYSPNLVVTTWVGFDNPRSLHEYAAQVALPMWIDLMKVAIKGQDEKGLIQPENIIQIRINPNNGLATRPDKPGAINEYFREDQIPPTEESVRYDDLKQEKESQEHLF